jgi:hypothetical protein
MVCHRIERAKIGCSAGEQFPHTRCPMRSNSSSVCIAPLLLFSCPRSAPPPLSMPHPTLGPALRAERFNMCASTRSRPDLYISRGRRARSPAGDAPGTNADAPAGRTSWHCCARQKRNHSSRLSFKPRGRRLYSPGMQSPPAAVALKSQPAIAAVALSASQSQVPLK